MMKVRGMLLGILVLFCLHVGIVSASSGKITVKLSEGVGSNMLYLKVATMCNGEWRLDEEFEKCQVNLNKIYNGEQLTEAAEKLKLYVYENQIEMRKSEKKDSNHNVCLEQLEEGLYLLVMEENDRVVMSSTLVSLPGWTGEGMSYDVTVVPKIAEKNSSPKTGWDSGEGLYICTLGIAFIMILSWLCYKRLYYSK